MNDVILASTPADSDAVETVRAHHAELAGGLTARVSALVAAMQAGHNLEQARQDLVQWCSAQLMPHAQAEEDALYPAGLALPKARMLVEAMIAEHRILADLVDELRHTEDAAQATRAATALRVTFDAHVAKENDLLLPALAEAPEVSLAELLGGMHESLGHADAPDTDAPHEEAGHTCGCHEHDDAGDPELDARIVPHAIRHATVFGALDAVRPGAAMVLIAPHDPLPLLAQLERRSPGIFGVSYLERGPEAWRLRFERISA